jgi:methanogenic corrinoid protein MtbC1
MPDVVGLSCVLTSCVSALKDTVEILRAALSDKRPPIIIGGTCVDRQILKYTQADLWGETHLRVFASAARLLPKMPEKRRSLILHS